MLLPARLRERLAGCDALVADFPFVHPVFSAPSAEGALRVLSTHNLEHQMFDDQGAVEEPLGTAPIVRAVELEGAAGLRRPRCACCAGDKQFFEAQRQRAPSILVPNGIDVRRFRGIEEVQVSARAAGHGPTSQGLPVHGEQIRPQPRGRRLPRRRSRRAHARWLGRSGIHILVVRQRRARLRSGGRASPPPAWWTWWSRISRPPTPRSIRWRRAGTNVKMCEFIAGACPS
jgi:hypothetical protein